MKSQHEASRALRIDVMLLRARLASSNFPNYTSRHYRKIKRQRRGAKRVSCIIKGVKYASLVAASKKFKVSTTTISLRLKSSKYPDYVSPDIPKNPPKPIKYNYNVKGKKYRSLQEIGDMEGLSKERIRQKMNDPKYPDYKRI